METTDVEWGDGGLRRNEVVAYPAEITSTMITAEIIARVLVFILDSPVSHEKLGNISRQESKQPGRLFISGTSLPQLIIVLEIKYPIIDGSSRVF